MLVLTWFGVVALMMAIIPSVALLPILLYIGMLIGAQAFQETPHNHAPAIVLALVPQIAAWGKTQIDNALGAAGTIGDKVGLDALGNNGVLYHGLQVLGSGATLAGIILGSVAVLIIDRKLDKAAGFAAGRRGADLLRPDPQRGDRHREDAGGGGGLSARARLFLFACAKKAGFHPPYEADSSHARDRRHRRPDA